MLNTTWDLSNISFKCRSHLKLVSTPQRFHLRGGRRCEVEEKRRARLSTSLGDTSCQLWIVFLFLFLIYPTRFSAAVNSACAACSTWLTPRYETEAAPKDKRDHHTWEARLEQQRLRPRGRRLPGHHRLVLVELAGLVLPDRGSHLLRHSAPQPREFYSRERASLLAPVNLGAGAVVPHRDGLLLQLLQAGERRKSLILSVRTLICKACCEPRMNHLTNPVKLHLIPHFKLTAALTVKMLGFCVIAGWWSIALNCGNRFRSFQFTWKF